MAVSGARVEHHPLLDELDTDAPPHQLVNEVDEVYQAADEAIRGVDAERITLAGVSQARGQLGPVTILVCVLVVKRPVNAAAELLQVEPLVDAADAPIADN